MLSRRQLLKHASCGFGYLACAALAQPRLGGAQTVSQEQNPLASKAPHFTPRATRVIFLFMNGGPSHVDTFDYKPELQKRDGQGVPASFAATNPKANAGDTLFASPWPFRQHGESGSWISDLYPHLARHADKLCILNSMQADSPAHIPACQQVHTGQTTFIRPSVGAWTLYGLGTENESLPGFVTIGNLGRGGGAVNRGSAFLPASFQATPIFNGTINHLTNRFTSPEVQRRQIGMMQELNQNLTQRSGADANLDAVIESFELAFRMQQVAPEVMDLARETPETLKQYGVGKAGDEFARNCLLARRMAEAGVRFIEVGGGGTYDQHTKLKEDMEQNAAISDRPIAALLDDLDLRGLLHDTLVMWGGEFGRLPATSRANGRDHNNAGFTFWLAGGGVCGGMVHGATDDFGFAAVKDKVHIHDLHATLLHLLGLNHERLTYRHSGRDFRLTDVHGQVIRSILA